MSRPVMSRRIRVAVVGGGISGLTAAFRLRQALGSDAQIDVVESSDRLGGVLRTVDVGGRAVDVGAEAFIVRRPEALALIDELGLADDVVSPSGTRPAIWSGAGLHPLPAPAMMGIPASPEPVAGLVDSDDLDRLAGEADRPLNWSVTQNPTVGDLVADRFGPSVVARSVDPMLGGVYSSLAADIGLREAIPALAARLDGGSPSLTAAVRSVIDSGAGASGPVFGTLIGGYRRLLDALTAAAAVTPALARAVVTLGSGADGWTLGFGDGGSADYDGVVLAVPAPVAGELLTESAPAIGEALVAVPRASSVVVSIALEPGTRLPDHSGVLVATGETLRAKAFTFSSRKWPHLAGDDEPVSVRASFGRHGAPVPDEDDEPGVGERLVADALADLDAVCAAAGVNAVSARVVDSYVQRWPGGLPVYGPGHLAAMARVDAHRPPRLALAGSAYAGVGVPACIGRAGRAAAAVVADLTPET